MQRKPQWQRGQLASLLKEKSEEGKAENLCRRIRQGPVHRVQRKPQWQRGQLASLLKEKSEEGKAENPDSRFWGGVRIGNTKHRSAPLQESRI